MPMHKETIGEYIHLPTSVEEEKLVLSFSPSSLPIQQRWRNNGLSADFLGDYFTTFFPHAKDEKGDISPREEARNAVTYIANELLENAMKYADERYHAPITISLQMRQDLLLFEETNAMSPDQGHAFRAHMDWLISNDPDILYIEALELAASREDGGSGLGLITMINDYQARLAWKIAPVDQAEFLLVTTQVVISV